jgi:hypothetical protein
MPSNISDKTLTLNACLQALGLVLMEGFVNISFGAWASSLSQTLPAFNRMSMQ